MEILETIGVLCDVILDWWLIITVSKQNKQIAQLTEAKGTADKTKGSPSK
jgi:hypothetical protein